jgi:hypothetical protein
MAQKIDRNYTEGSILTKALSDFFTTKFLTLTIAPFVITILISLSFLYYLSGEFFDMLNVALQVAEDPNAVQAQNEMAQFAKEYPILAMIAGSFIFKAIAGALFYVIGGWFAILLSVVLAVVIIGFFTPYIVAEVQRRHYPTIERRATVPMVDYIIFMVKKFALFVLFFFLSLPFYFIPLVNIIAINAPFYFLFHSLLTRDVAGEIFNKDEMQIVFNRAKWRIVVTTFILYLLSLIPGVGVFGQVFFVIVLAHQFFQESIYIRENL